MNNKLIRISSIIISLVALIVVNVFDFVIGLPKLKLEVFITLIIFSNLLIIIEEILILLETRKKYDTMYKLLGVPLHYWSISEIIVQLTFSSVVINVSKVVSIPLSLVVVIEVILTALTIVQIVFGFILRIVPTELDKKINAKTNLFESFRKRIECAKIDCTDEELIKSFDLLIEKMRYMNAVSSESSIEIDEKINNQIILIEQSVSMNNAESKEVLLSSLMELDKLLSKREILTKR